MDMENASPGYTIHVYMPEQARIACSPHADVRAVIRQDWLHRLDGATICPHCLRAIERRKPAAFVAREPWLVRSAMTGRV